MAARPRTTSLFATDPNQERRLLRLLNFRTQRVCMVDVRNVCAVFETGHVLVAVANGEAATACVCEWPDADFLTPWASSPSAAAGGSGGTGGGGGGGSSSSASTAAGPPVAGGAGAAGDDPAWRRHSAGGWLGGFHDLGLDGLSDDEDDDEDDGGGGYGSLNGGMAGSDSSGIRSGNGGDGGMAGSTAGLSDDGFVDLGDLGTMGAGSRRTTPGITVTRSSGSTGGGSGSGSPGGGVRGAAGRTQAAGKPFGSIDVLSLPDGPAAHVFFRLTGNPVRAFEMLQEQHAATIIKLAVPVPLAVLAQAGAKGASMVRRFARTTTSAGSLSHSFHSHAHGVGGSAGGMGGMGGMGGSGAALGMGGTAGTQASPVSISVLVNRDRIVDCQPGVAGPGTASVVADFGPRALFSDSLEGMLGHGGCGRAAQRRVQMQLFGATWTQMSEMLGHQHAWESIDLDLGSASTGSPALVSAGGSRGAASLSATAADASDFGGSDGASAFRMFLDGHSPILSMSSASGHSSGIGGALGGALGFGGALGGLGGFGGLGDRAVSPASPNRLATPQQTQQQSQMRGHSPVPASPRSPLGGLGGLGGLGNILRLSDPPEHAPAPAAVAFGMPTATADIAPDAQGSGSGATGVGLRRSQSVAGARTSSLMPRTVSAGALPDTQPPPPPPRPASAGGHRGAQLPMHQAQYVQQQQQPPQQPAAESPGGFLSSWLRGFQ
ncbi:hypothetical protein HK105_203674 [Polyrhizophydium stewartii]|uniref:Uncharacterized protein n=1 Tax=Polyrhizophydium stewartii TaxID=2732419 RepID=A0ABR4NBI4_9FUNG|nr:hypothetical protein HK105_006965 [Polyrhizophydium stewartii]